MKQKAPSKAKGLKPINKILVVNTIFPPPS